MATRDSCTYRMNATERKNLEYEDGEEILDVVYQYVTNYYAIINLICRCQRYAQYCCGLNCCNLRKKRAVSENNFSEQKTLFSVLPFLIPLVIVQTYLS